MTLLVDASGDMADEVDGKSLLAWTTAGLKPMTDGALTNAVGLWAFSDSGYLPPDGYPELVTSGLLSGDVDDSTRKAAIEAALGDLTAEGDRWAYGALIAACQQVPDEALDGRKSRILLITSGVDETPTTPRTAVIDAVEQAADSVRVDVIGLGDSVPVAAYTEIAKAGGGEYIPVTDPSKLAATLTNLMTIES